MSSLSQSRADIKSCLTLKIGLIGSSRKRLALEGDFQSLLIKWLASSLHIWTGTAQEEKCSSYTLRLSSLKETLGGNIYCYHSWVDTTHTMVWSSQMSLVCLLLPVLIVSQPSLPNMAIKKTRADVHCLLLFRLVADIRASVSSTELEAICQIAW